MLGAYHSSVALVATAVAERHGIPFLVGDSVALNITGRGFKWMFRTDQSRPISPRLYALLRGPEEAGARSTRSRSSTKTPTTAPRSPDSIDEAAKRANIVGAQIPYSATATDVSAQVLQLKEMKPDVVIFISYTADTILYFKTMKNLDYLPPIMIGDDAGFSDPSFIPNVGELAQGAMNRSAWDIGKPGSNDVQDQRDVQGQDRPRPRRHQRAQDAGLPGFGRCDQPRRLDGPGEDPRRRSPRPISSPSS